MTFYITLTTGFGDHPTTWLCWTGNAGYYRRPPTRRDSTGTSSQSHQYHHREETLSTIYNSMCVLLSLEEPPDELLVGESILLRRKSKTKQQNQANRRLLRSARSSQWVWNQHSREIYVDYEISYIDVLCRGYYLKQSKSMYNSLLPPVPHVCCCFLWLSGCLCVSIYVEPSNASVWTVMNCDKLW